MGDKRKKKKKTKKVVARGTTVNVNVSMNINEKVKRIKSRRRPNLREMRRALPGSGSPAMFGNPGFYGNVGGLTNNALNTLQNERYALERTLREIGAHESSRVTLFTLGSSKNFSTKTKTLSIIQAEPQSTN